MGYYTSYTVSILHNNDKSIVNYVKEQLESISNYSFEEDGQIINSDGGIKWYEWEKDIQAVSLLFPEYLFLVEGEGEEQGDIWKYYVRNGKGIRLEPTITFPTFTEDMLK